MTHSHRVGLLNNNNPVSANNPLPVEVKLPLESNGALPVNIQDQTSKPIDTYFLQEISPFTLAVDTVSSTKTTLVYDFTATTGHGIVIGSEIILLDVIADVEFYATVLNVVGDVITVDRPVDNVFPAATTLARIVNSNMNVNGSVTPQIFTARAGVNPIDFVRFIVSITDDSSMDDGKFGGLTALPRGLVFRIVDGFQKTIFNFKTNGEIKNFCHDGTYTDATLGPGGSEGFNARITFGGQSKHGVVLRVSGAEVLQWVVQDDLTDLESLKIVGEGHEVTD